MENVGISYIPDLRYTLYFKLQSLFLECVCAVYSALWIVWGAAVRRQTLHFFAFMIPAAAGSNNNFCSHKLLTIR